MLKRLPDGSEVQMVQAVSPGQVSLQFITIIGSASGTVDLEFFRANGRTLGIYQVLPSTSDRGLPDLMDDNNYALDTLMSQGASYARVKAVSGGPFFYGTGGSGVLGGAIETSITASSASGEPLTVGTVIGGFTEGV